MIVHGIWLVASIDESPQNIQLLALENSFCYDMRNKVLVR
jgi:hypothetical protein